MRNTAGSIASMRLSESSQESQREVVARKAWRGAEARWRGCPALGRAVGASYQAEESDNDEGNSEFPS